MVVSSAATLARRRRSVERLFILEVRRVMLLAAVQAQGAAGYRQLATREWWGASDSIADTYLYQEGESLTMKQEIDNRALRAALTTIADAMKAAGVTPPE